MTTRARRVARRLLEVFDWRTFAVAGGFLLLILIGYLLFGAFQAAHDATASADLRGKAATRRIDLLNSQIQQLQAEIAAGRDRQGQLTATVAALAEQVRQMGGRPVASSVVVTLAPAPARTVTAAPSASARPRPTPRPSPSSTPTPRPSPTCTRLPIVGACRPLKK